MPVKIDGPSGRQEISNEYRKNYDRIFNRTSLYRNGKKLCDIPPRKSKQDGGKDGKSNS